MCRAVCVAVGSLDLVDREAKISQCVESSLPCALSQVTSKGPVKTSDLRSPRFCRVEQERIGHRGVIKLSGKCQLPPMIAELSAVIG